MLAILILFLIKIIISFLPFILFTFINKMDREAQDPFKLLDDIENELGIKTYPMNWPIGSGKEFKGVYERDNNRIIAFFIFFPSFFYFVYEYCYI